MLACLGMYIVFREIRKWFRSIRRSLKARNRDVEGGRGQQTFDYEKNRNPEDSYSDDVRIFSLRFDVRFSSGVVRSPLPGTLREWQADLKGCFFRLVVENPMIRIRPVPRSSLRLPSFPSPNPLGSTFLQDRRCTPQQLSNHHPCPARLLPERTLS